MNSLAKTVVIGGAVLGGALYGFSAHNAQVSRLDLEGRRAHLRSAYVERMSYAYSLPDNDRYRDELASATRWYEAELKDLYNQHPEAAKAAEADAAAKPAASAEKAALGKEYADVTKGFHDLLKSGKYAPVYSVPTMGVRLDLLGMRRETYEGKSRIRIDAVLWGAPRRETVTKQEGGKSATAKVNLDFAFKRLGFEFVDAKQKLLGGGETGAPTFLVDYPERFIPDFPPQAALAVWYVDPFPAGAVTLNLKIDGELRSPAGAPIPVALGMGFPARDELKVQAGEKFEGEERLMPEEELDRAKK